MKSSLKPQNFQIIKNLGQGTYGKCYLVKNLIQNELCVLKQIQVGGMNQEQTQQTMKQARILQALDHPCIIKCIQAYIQNGTLNIFMDYADAGDLSNKIKDAKGCYFSENQILNWFTQICLAMKHVHDRKIIHRDLKAQNIFLTSQNVVKLGDFGIAKPLQMTLQKIKTVVGTPYYMSPEICQNKQYSLKTDIWSLGVILYEMCALKQPFDANSLPALALKISRCQYGALPSHYSKELKRLINDLLQVQPSRRPCINDILKYSFIKSRIDSFLPQGIRERQFSHTTLHSQHIFQRENLKKDISRLATQQSQLSSIFSPRNQGTHHQMFSHQTPQHKGGSAIISKIKQSNSSLKQKNPFDKKKKPQIRKRQVSQPSLTPKSNQRKLKSNISLTNLQRKKSDKDKQMFRKKKIQNLEMQEYQTQLSHINEMKQIVGEVKQMRQHLISDRHKQQKSSRIKLVDNFIKQESDSENSSQKSFQQHEQETQFQRSLHLKSNNQQDDNLSFTLQQILLETMGQRQLSKIYSRIQENDGFVPNQNQFEIKNQGLISLLYGLNKFIST